MMKAAVRTGVLGTTLTFTDQAKRPKLNSKRADVLIKVHAASINPVDYKVPGFIIGKMIGMDFCGTVEQIGSDTSSSNIQVGDLVYGHASQGSLAEYTIAPIQSIAKAPSDVKKSWEATELATLNVAYQSALQCLKQGNIIIEPSGKDDKSEKSVLVIGASGGCGIAALQLCKSRAKKIVAICSGKNSQLVKDMGATDVVDYTNEEELSAFFRDNVGKFDCVVDAATNSGGGEDYWKRSLPLLKNTGGQYTSLNGSATKWLRAFSGTQKPNETLIMCKQNTADLELIVQMLEATGDRPHISKTVQFSKQGMEEAFELLKSRRTRGKIVFQIV